MSVKKIVFVTPGEYDHNWLTHAANSQLRAVATHITKLAPESRKVFRTSEELSEITSDTLLALCNTLNTLVEDYSERPYHHLLSDLGNVGEIVASTQKWEVVIVGITQSALRSALKALSQEWYKVVDPEVIHHEYNVYAVTIEPQDPNKTAFFQAPWGR